MKFPSAGRPVSAASAKLPPRFARDDRRAGADEQKIRCVVSVHIAEREPATEWRQDDLSYPQPVICGRVDAIG